MRMSPWKDLGIIDLCTVARKRDNRLPQVDTNKAWLSFGGFVMVTGATITAAVVTQTPSYTGDPVFWAGIAVVALGATIALSAIIELRGWKRIWRAIRLLVWPPSSQHQPCWMTSSIVHREGVDLQLWLCNGSWVGRKIVGVRPLGQWGYMTTDLSKRWGGKHRYPDDFQEGAALTSGPFHVTWFTPIDSGEFDVELRVEAYDAFTIP